MKFFFDSKSRLLNVVIVLISTLAITLLTCTGRVGHRKDSKRLDDKKIEIDGFCDDDGYFTGKRTANKYE